jgi:hypothetical protein
LITELQADRVLLRTVGADHARAQAAVAEPLELLEHRFERHFQLVTALIVLFRAAAQLVLGRQVPLVEADHRPQAALAGGHQVAVDQVWFEPRAGHAGHDQKLIGVDHDGVFAAAEVAPREDRAARLDALDHAHELPIVEA